MKAGFLAPKLGIWFMFLVFASAALESLSGSIVCPLKPVDLRVPHSCMEQTPTNADIKLIAMRKVSVFGHLQDTHICFLGDSLARQLFVNIACKDAKGRHNYQYNALPWKASRGAVVYPIVSSLANNVTLSHFAGMGRIPLLPSPTLRSCNVVVASSGIWYTHNFNETLDEYESRMKQSVRQMVQANPKLKIFLKPCYSTIVTGDVSNRFQDTERFRGLCEDANTSALKQYADHLLFPSPTQRYIRQINERIDKIGGDTGVHVIGGHGLLYNRSMEYICDHPRKSVKDQVHFCLWPSSSSGIFDVTEDLLVSERLKTNVAT